MSEETLKPPIEAQAEKIIKERFEKFKEGRHSKAGKAFENETRNSLLEIGEGWIYRPFDAKSFYVINPVLQPGRQPCDFFFLHRGTLYAFECKSSKASMFRYDFTHIPQHQIDSLTDIEKNGGISYFLICNRRKRNAFQCYAIKPQMISLMKQYLTENALRSMLYTDIAANGITLARQNKTQMWNIQVLLEKFKEKRNRGDEVRIEQEIEKRRIEEIENKMEHEGEM